ncbi:hypothetical protein GCM10023320_49860 [Pseudonocardia adelaidensis]|uniref:Uncharacterized protein n=1 Tax=Pseudonocardia adelaidensis TaxID=648754 RepID=A0ABP9NP16_9PSEU
MDTELQWPRRIHRRFDVRGAPALPRLGRVGQHGRAQRLVRRQVVELVTHVPAMAALHPTRGAAPFVPQVIPLELDGLTHRGVHVVLRAPVRLGETVAQMSHRDPQVAQHPAVRGGVLRRGRIVVRGDVDATPLERQPAGDHPFRQGLARTREQLDDETTDPVRQERQGLEPVERVALVRVQRLIRGPVQRDVVEAGVLGVRRRERLLTRPDLPCQLLRLRGQVRARRRVVTLEVRTGGFAGASRARVPRGVSLRRRGSVRALTAVHVPRHRGVAVVGPVDTRPPRVRPTGSGSGARVDAAGLGAARVTPAAAGALHGPARANRGGAGRVSRRARRVPRIVDVTCPRRSARAISAPVRVAGAGVTGAPGRRRDTIGGGTCGLSFRTTRPGRCRIAGSPGRSPGLGLGPGTRDHPRRPARTRGADSSGTGFRRPVKCDPLPGAHVRAPPRVGRRGA